MSGRTTFTILATLTFVVPAIAARGATGVDAPRSVVAERPVKLSVSLDKPIAQVVEPVQLVLTVDAPRGTRVEIPKLPRQLGGFEVRNSEQANDLPAANGAEDRQWVLAATLETIETGDHTIPPLTIHYATGANSAEFKTLSSEPIQIHIASVLEDRADPTSLHDIKGTVDIAIPATHSYAWIGWTVAGGGVLALLALLMIVVAKRKRAPSPADWALAELERLEQIPIADAENAVSTFNEVVDIVREFVGFEFNVLTASRTTREFLAQASTELGLGETAGRRLALLASVADQIKFARRSVDVRQVGEAIAQAKAFIVECTQHRQATERGAA